MTQILDINASEVVKFTNKLEKLHRSALPVAVRQTLNDAAKDMKISGKGYNGTIEREFKKNFTIRAKNFIRSHTGFNNSKNTFDINQMESSAGVLEGKSGAGDRLAIQERGGNLERERIPTDIVRINEDNRSLVSKKFYYNKFKDFPKGQIIRDKEKTIIKTDWGVLMVSRGGIWKTLYSLKRHIRIPKAPFNAPAALSTLTRLDAFYVKNAEKKLAKEFYGK